MTLLAVLVFLGAAGAALVAVTDLSVTAARAQAAADAAALAGAGVSPLLLVGSSAQAPEPAAAAREVARANGAIFVRGDTSSWPLRYGVTVEVAPRTGWVRKTIGPVRAEAVAGVRPRVPESAR